MKKSRKEGTIYLIKNLTKPFSKRFNYHFTGNRKTNNIEKVCLILFPLLNTTKQLDTIYSPFLKARMVFNTNN